MLKNIEFSGFKITFSTKKTFKIKPKTSESKNTTIQKGKKVAE